MFCNVTARATFNCMQCQILYNFIFPTGWVYALKTIAVNKVTNRWRNHNNKTTKISELNKIIELYEL